MAVTTTPRFGITRWSAGTDLFTRVQMDTSHAAIESKGAIYLQGTASARPTAGTVGRFYYATDTQVFTYDDGVGWRNVSSPDTVTLNATQTLTNKTLTAPSISGTVTGTNVVMTGVDSISSPDFIQFDTTNAASPAIGRLMWNNTEGTLEFLLRNGNVDLQIGQEQVMHGLNNTGVDIPKGTAVMATGSQGDRITIGPAITNGSVRSKYMLGIAAETITNGNDGFVTTFGQIKGLDTSTWPVGTVLWMNPATPGGLTATEPSAPNLKIAVAMVIKSGPGGSGILFVRPTHGLTLNELHNVTIATPATDDVLAYDGSKWVNQAIASMLDGISLSGTVSLPATTSIGDVSSTEISYLDGVTSSIQTQLNSKSPTNSPTFTGTPAGPTAAVNTNTTQLATTAFVMAQIADDAPTKTGTGATGTWGIDITGNAGTATKLATARTISLTGDITGSASFDGSANISIATEQDSQPFVATFMMAGL